MSDSADVVLKAAANSPALLAKHNSCNLRTADEPASSHFTAGYADVDARGRGWVGGGEARGKSCFRIPITSLHRIVNRCSLRLRQLEQTMDLRKQRSQML